MPGLSRTKVAQHHSSPTSTCSSSPSSLCNSSSIWSRSNTEDVNFTQLEKFWNGLPADARRTLLRIDKQTLFEQVRKNMYCSRCHGLLVEGFSQIVAYGKNHLLRGNSRKVFPESEISSSGCSVLQDDARDPSLHPWGGLAATRDCTLTVLDCFLDGTSLEVLQNVFESARGRERERELLYPDACGGNGRGWISQSSGMYSSGRGHGMKETCALHTARLSCEALVDFWSALSEETRRSLLRMKEEDFIERLMFRFDSKRFCRDCRRNVLREFKEMKELKRARREPRCTRWFCAADSTFQYEVSDSTVQADWHESFAGEVGTLYKHFDWAIGTEEGKNDIYGFENVGLSDRVEVEGLELGSISDCYITVRAYRRRDDRYIKLSAKAHALKGELCVHRRLFVGDGIVSITEGESIQRFFEHAEETEEEEDEDAFDKDGNELDSEGPRSQKHAKSPELARDFLLDAATVIFKEQVEKAFREGTARQNAHSIFVCLAIGLLEDRVRVACKEIATLEMQNKLLEEEEHERREEEERRERRKLKEKEKKLRRKEKLKSKERDKEKPKCEKARGEENGPEASSLSKPDEEPVSDMAAVRLVSGDSESCVSQSAVEDATSGRESSEVFTIEQSKAAKRREGKRQQATDPVPPRTHRRGVFERVSNRDSTLQERQSNNEPLKTKIDQQCSCTSAFWVKGGQQICARDSAPKVTRKATLDSRQLHVKASVFKSSQKINGAMKKEGLSYTKVVTSGWTETRLDQLKHEQENGLFPQVQAVVQEVDVPSDSLVDHQPEQEMSADDQVMQVETVKVENVVIPTDQQEAASGLPFEAQETRSGDHEADVSCPDQLSTSECIDPETDNHNYSTVRTEQLASEEGESRQPEVTRSSRQPPESPEATTSCSVPAPAIGSPYVMVSNPPPVCSAEVVRNGYVNGFVRPVKNAYASSSPMMDMLPCHGQIRHPAHHMHHHHRPHHPAPPPPPPLPPPSHPGFACYPVPGGAWGPQTRNSYIPPVFVPGPAAFGFPRYPFPRMFHPPLRMPEIVQHPPPPSFVTWVQPPGCLQQQHQQHFAEVQMETGSFQNGGFSLQPDCGGDKLLDSPDSSGFSLFHFGVPSLNGDVESDSSDTKEEEVVVSSKCMDRLPSGINKGSMLGEYSLFAAAPGKGFGFF